MTGATYTEATDAKTGLVQVTSTSRAVIDTGIDVSKRMASQGRFEAYLSLLLQRAAQIAAHGD